jgi:serine/threonine protein kinase
MKHPQAEAYEQKFTGKEISNYKIGTFIAVGQQGAVFKATKIRL